MRSPPKCSVIIATLSGLDVLRTAIASVRMQGFENIEILVVDDASSDRTTEWLAAKIAQDPRIVPVRTESRGASRRRNLALSQARAPIVAFLDGGDFWWPGKLLRAVRFHEANPAVAFTFTDFLNVGFHGETLGTGFDFWRPNEVDRTIQDFKLLLDPEIELLAINVVDISTVVASRKALEAANGFPAAGLSAQNWRLGLDLAAEYLVAYTPATTTTHRARPASVAEDPGAQIKTMREIIDPYRTRTEWRVRRAVRQAAARIDTAEAEYARALGDNFGAATAHLRALARWPQWRTARAAAADFRATLRGAASQADDFLVRSAHKISMGHSASDRCSRNGVSALRQEGTL